MPWLETDVREQRIEFVVEALQPAAWWPCGGPTAGPAARCSGCSRPKTSGCRRRRL